MRSIAIFMLVFFFSLSTQAESPEPLEKAHAWVMAFMIEMAPPGRKIYYEYGQETQEEALSRYSDIAWDIVHLAYDPKTVPLFSSPEGRAQTAAVWLGIMLHESGFTKHVDYNLGKHGRGDSGMSWCMMQLRIGKGRTVPWNIQADRQPWWGDNPADIFAGYSGPELIEDRKRCIGEGHHMIRVSFKLCKSLPIQYRLTAYAIGKCFPKNAQDAKEAEEITTGRAKSRARMWSAIKYFENTKETRGFLDEDVMAALKLKAMLRLETGIP